MIDLIAILEEGLRAKPPRGDEYLAHASDVVCDRQAWARRRGEPMLPLDFRTLVKFELGHQFERGIGDILTDALEPQGYMVRRDIECSLGEVIGHADLIAFAGYENPKADDFLLEIKSTSFLRGKVPEEAQPHYVEQAAMYAAACNVERFGILVGCRESGKLALFWFSLDDLRPDEFVTWRAWAAARAEELARVTDPNAPMPPAEPRTSWACRTCRWANCEKNPAHQQDTAAALERSLA